MDVCQLRGSQGPVVEGATISGSEPLQLRVSLRGCKADSAQMCKAQLITRVDGPGRTLSFQALGPGGKLIDLNELEPFVFRKNSPLTSMEVTAAAEVISPGDYTVTVVAEDLVAHTSVEQQFRFHLESKEPPGRAEARPL